MDANRFREAYGRLRLLDERHSHKVRPRRGGSSRMTTEQLDERVKDLGNYVVELRSVVDDLFQAIAASPAKKE